MSVSMLTQLVDVTMKVDVEGKILEIDDHIRDLSGHGPSEVLGCLIWEFLHPDDIDEAAAVFTRELTESGYREATPIVRCKSSSGSWLTCEVLCDSFHINEDGTIILGLRRIAPTSHASDVGRSLETAAAKGLVRRYDCLLLADVSGVLTVADQRVAGLLGVSAEDLVAHEWFGRLHPSDIDIAREVFEAETHPSNKKSRSFIARLRHDDGTWRRCEVTVINSLSDPVLHGILIAIRYVGIDGRRSTGSIKTDQWSTLTRAEQGIVTAVSCGHSNKAIARECGKSIRTVEAQLNSIYRKLGLSSRAQLVAEAHAR